MLMHVAHIVADKQCGRSVELFYPAAINANQYFQGRQRKEALQFQREFRWNPTVTIFNLHQKCYLEKDRPILISAFLFTSEALWPKLFNNNIVNPPMTFL